MRSSSFGAALFRAYRFYQFLRDCVRNSRLALAFRLRATSCKTLSKRASIGFDWIGLEQDLTNPGFRRNDTLLSSESERGQDTLKTFKR